MSTCSLPLNTALLAAVLLASFSVAILVQRFYLDPLSKYKGPPLWILTRFPYMMAFRNGQLCHKLREFHEQYGEVVRVAPNELSYTDPEALPDIYSKRSGLPKDPIRFPPPKPGQPISILDALEDDHIRIRKAWNSSFTARALADQEPLVMSYVDKLISQLQNRIAAGETCLDLQQWYSYCTFDIIGALSFGEDFACLENNRYHQWVAGLVFSIKGKVQIAACRWYPWLYSILVKWNTSPQAIAAMAKAGAHAREKVLQRLTTQVNHPDFLANLKASKHELSEGEIVTNSATMIFAGSHTLQTLLTGFTFLLMKNPDKLAVVTREVRQAGQKLTSFDMKTLSQLPYLNACLQEAFRFLTPVPLNMTRLVPPGGAKICGELIPAGTIVGYMSWAANHSPRNFTDPSTYAPERWLQEPDEATGTTAYSSDRRNACAPFLIGPRDCLGQNLARMEILHIMANVLLHFDLALPEELGPSETLQRWEDLETYAVWTRFPLMVRLTSAD